MRIIRIPKKAGTWRVIYAPNPEEKAALKALVPELNAAALAEDKHGVAHGFMPGRSPVTNALAHRGYAYSLSFDLEDWFNTVTREHFLKVMPNCWKTHIICFVHCRAVQGLPTSPAIANLAASPMDNDIMALRIKGRFGYSFCYSRYADDLSFSFNNEATARWLMKEIPAIVERHRFKINPAKTKLQCARAGRRMITGVAVGDKDIHVPRFIKRKLRAATHKAGKNPWSRQQQRGLKEWSLLKLPSEFKPPTTITADVVKLTIKILSASKRILCAPFQRKFS
jgi:hypothetical protein